MPSAWSSESAAPPNDLTAFYENEGWSQDEQGLFGDTRAFLDTRDVSLNFTQRCIARLGGKYFQSGGEFLLDAGSGPIPHDALLKFHDRFERRVCVDLSVRALAAAKAKLGDRGIYVQGDLTNLPIKSDSMDAITCNHVIYQIPPEKQAAAFLELWRVLKPGGISVIVYVWPHARLERQAARAARFLLGKREEAAKEAAAHKKAETLPHHPHPLTWIQSQQWPFELKLDSFRVVSQGMMNDHVSDDWRGRLFLKALFALQVLMPAYAGKHGMAPTFVIRKPLPKTANVRIEPSKASAPQNVWTTSATNARVAPRR